MACSANKTTTFKQSPGKCLNLNFKTPEYKTCGNKNPSYKNYDYYYSNKYKRSLNRKLVEDYWTGILLQGVAANPYENLSSYYNNIVTYMKVMYNHFKNDYVIMYSNYSVECSSLLIIKRCLRNIFSEEEISRLILLLKLKNSCDCLE